MPGEPRWAKQGVARIRLLRDIFFDTWHGMPCPLFFAPECIKDFAMQQLVAHSGFGIVRVGSRQVAKMLLTRTGATTLDELAKEFARTNYGANLVELPEEVQLQLLERAEKRLLDQNIEREAQDDQAPPPDDMAPSGYEKVTDETGKTHWRPKDQPGTQVKVERPEAGY